MKLGSVLAWATCLHLPSSCSFIFCLIYLELLHINNDQKITNYYKCNVDYDVDTLPWITFRHCFIYCHHYHQSIAFYFIQPNPITTIQIPYPYCIDATYQAFTFHRKNVPTLHTLHTNHQYLHDLTLILQTHQSPWSS